MPKKLKKLLKILAVTFLVSSWLLTSWPRIWEKPAIPPEIQEAQAAYPVVESGYTSNTAAASSLTLTKPSSVQVGDLLLILVGNDPSNSTTPQWDDTTYKPTGFTFINEVGNSTSDSHAGAFYRVADGTEGNTIDVSAQSSNDYWGFYIRVSGVNTTTPINAIGSGIISSGSPINITGVDTTVSETLAFYVQCFDGGDGDPFTPSDTGWSKTADIESGSGTGNASGSWGTKQVAGGSTGTVTVTASVGDGMGGFQFAVAPPNAPSNPALYNGDGGANQIAFNDTRQNDTTPIFRASATWAPGFNRFQIELNTASDFSGTAYTETFSGTYSSDTEYNLQTTSSLNLPTTDGVTYYVRARASADGGTVYSPWSTGTWTYTYTSSAGGPEWFQTTDEQFDTGKLEGTQTTGSDSVQAGGGAAFDQTDTFNSYTGDPQCDQKPNFGNWTSQNGSDGTNGWATDPNTTASSGTGPSAVYDQAYLYLESSGTTQTCGAGATTGSSQYVESNTINASTYALYFEFVYNMTGDMDGGPASLHVDAWNGSLWDEDVTGSAIHSGQQTSWTATGAIDLTSYTNSDFKVRIRYIMSTGTAYQNDVAVDNLHIYGDLRSGASGTIMSPEVDYDWVTGQSSWGEVAFSTTETNGDVKLRVYYTVSIACDTIVPDEVLSGNSSGFDVSASPVDISGLTPVATTYNKICLRTTLTDSGGTPYLNDWTVAWSSGAVVSVTITTDGSVTYGIVAEGSSKNTIDLSDTQTAQNDGNVTETFNIKTSNATGGTSWALGSTPGTNVFVHEFSINGGSNWTKFNIVDEYQQLATGITADGTQDFDLRITVPSESSDYQEKTITITIQAVEE